jgi:hypothetical protein
MANGAGSDWHDGAGATPEAHERGARQPYHAGLRRQLAAILRHGAPPGPPAPRASDLPGSSGLPLSPPLDPCPGGATGGDPERCDWAGLDWPALQALARAERLDALLYVALLGARAFQAPPPAVRAELEAAYWRTKVANLLALDAVAGFVGALAVAEVPAVVLKGAALAFTVYGDPALRPLGDIDVLVHPHQVAVALRVLGLLGYAPVPGSLAVDTAARVAAGEERILQRRSEVTFVRDGMSAAGVPTQVDLHWGLNGRALLRRSMDTRWFWDHTRVAALGRRELCIFGEEAQLLHLCAHTLQHGVPRLRWTYDIALLLSRCRLAWEDVLAGAKRCGLGIALQSSLAAVALIWGVAAPAWVQDQLAALPVSVAEARLRRFTWSGDSRAVATFDAMSQPDLRSALDIWLAAALPPRSYLQQRYKIVDMHLLPAYYLLHAVRGTVLSGLSALRVLCDRSERADHAGQGGGDVYGPWSGNGGAA